MLKITLIVLLFLVSACDSYRAKKMAKDAAAYTAVAVSHEDFKPKQGQRFSWYAPVIWSNPDHAINNTHFNQLLASAVENELIDRGYIISANKRTADYIFGVAVLDGSGERTEQLQHFFKLFPGMLATSRRFEKATVMIAVVPADAINLARSALPSTQDILWRAGLEAFVLGDALDMPSRQARLKAFTKKLMTSFP
jgi:hypothetical protein